MKILQIEPLLHGKSKHTEITFVHRFPTTAEGHGLRDLGDKTKQTNYLPY